MDQKRQENDDINTNTIKKTELMVTKKEQIIKQQQWHQHQLKVQ